MPIVAPFESAIERPPGNTSGSRFEPPVSALGPLFRYRLEKLHRCRVSLEVQVSSRPTRRVLGGYYKSRQLVRVYSHDKVEGRRPLEELFGTFLHEVTADSSGESWAS
jgi:hypothetical protein